MSVEDNNSINLIMLHRTQNEAEPLLSALRNRGQAARSHFVASAAELEKIIHEQIFDVVCVHLAADTVDPKTAIALIKNSGKDLPVIGLTDGYTPEHLTQGLALGVEDVVDTAQTKHVLHAIQRAYSQLIVRRQKRALEHMLTESERRCQLLLNGSKDAIAYVHEGMHIYANDTYRELFGYDDMEELSCMPLVDLVSTTPPDALKAQLKKVSTGKKVQLDVQGEHESGEHFKARLSVSPASYEGEPCIQITISKDQANNEDLQARVRELASLDAQTQLYNRAYFDEALADVINDVQRTHSKSSLAFLQIINLSEHKQALGIAGTDLLLSYVADALRKAYADTELLARFSDDAFTLICPTDIDTCRKKTERFLKAIANHLFEVDGQTVQVTLHGGMSPITETTSSDTETITQAHEACMRAIKENTPVVVYRPGDKQLTDNTMASQLRKALESNQLRILFQPLMNLRHSSEENYEVLVRIVGDDEKLLTPHEFLEAANVADLAHHLDRWVFRKTVIELARHRRDKGATTRAFVHLTAATVQDPTFLPWANKTLREAKLPGDAIVFQISEHLAHSYLKQLKAFSKGLSVLHTKLAIGRFGHPEKGELLLRHVNIDFIKVDPSFVKDLDNSDNLNKLTELVNFINDHDVASIVPHIESAAILASLWQAGVHYVQGHYLQQPASSMDYQFEEDE
ncbi:MAG: EAL domain-containing protein [Natronospirillum sp.]